MNGLGFSLALFGLMLIGFSYTKSGRDSEFIEFSNKMKGIGIFLVIFGFLIGNFGE